MTLTDKMEELSIGFMKIVANSSGYFNMTGRDYGTDMHIRFARGRSERNGTRYMTSGRGLDLQLKAVHRQYTREDNDFIVYNLDVKNYNDLVERANELGSVNPLILILFVFPDERDKWMSMDISKLVMEGSAYFYCVPRGIPPTLNSSTIAIRIPKMDIVDPNIFNNLFETFA